MPIELPSPLEQVRAYLLAIAECELDPDLRQRGGASDLVQQTLLIAHRAQRRFEGTTPAEYHAWLRGILLNTLHNFRRQHRRGPLDLAGVGPAARDPGDTPSTLASRQEERQRLAAQVSCLPPEYREALFLRFERELPFAEVGRLMGGRTEDAARMLVGRAVAQLRRRMTRACA